MSPSTYIPLPRIGRVIKNQMPNMFQPQSHTPTAQSTCSIANGKRHSPHVVSTSRGHHIDLCIPDHSLLYTMRSVCLSMPPTCRHTHSIHQNARVIANARETHTERSKSNAHGIVFAHITRARAVPYCFCRNAAKVQRATSQQAVDTASIDHLPTPCAHLIPPPPPPRSPNRWSNVRASGSR